MEIITGKIEHGKTVMNEIREVLSQVSELDKVYYLDMSTTSCSGNLEKLRMYFNKVKKEMGVNFVTREFGEYMMIVAPSMTNSTNC